MTELKVESTEPKEDVTGVAQHFHEVIRTHGRAMFNLVYAGGVTGQALIELSKLVNGHPAGVRALQVIAAMHNVTAQTLIKQAGWTEEALGACDVAAQQAMAQAVVVPKGRIILPH